jgi:hypothetical protein
MNDRTGTRSSGTDTAAASELAAEALFAHLPSSATAAQEMAEAIQDVSEKLRRGFFRDRLILATYIEKSGNTTICDCIAWLQAHFGPERPAPQSSYGIRRQSPWVKAFDDHTLRPESILYKRQGGVMNRMFQPDPCTFQMLDLLQSKYFVILRHPADQVSAMYTYIPERVAPEWANNPIFTMPWRLYDGSHDQDAVLRELIGGGYLFSMLAFMTNWLIKRDRTRSKVLRFEDFVADRHGFFDGILQFLYGQRLSADRRAELDAVADRHLSRNQNGEQVRRYSGGYTGREGIWSDYLNAESLAQYRTVVQQFLAVYPGAEVLLEFYPDIALSS